jgi:hypothetical protein
MVPPIFWLPSPNEAWWAVAYFGFQKGGPNFCWPPWCSYKGGINQVFQFFLLFQKYFGQRRAMAKCPLNTPLWVGLHSKLPRNNIFFKHSNIFIMQIDYWLSEMRNLSLLRNSIIYQEIKKKVTFSLLHPHRLPSMTVGQESCIEGGWPVSITCIHTTGQREHVIYVQRVFCISSKQPLSCCARPFWTYSTLKNNLVRDIPTEYYLLIFR